MKWKIVLTVLAAMVICAAGSVFLLREQLANYWIRKQLADQLARALGADVELQGVEWNDGVLQARRFRMTGGDFPFIRFEARGLRAAVDGQRLLEPSAEPLHLEIAEADVVLRGAAGREQTGATGVRTPPLDLLVNHVTLRHADDESWSLEGTSLRAVQKGASWSFSGNGGVFSFPGWPAMEVERVSVEHSGDRWRIGSFAFKDKQGGALGGSAVLEGNLWSGEFSWQGINLHTFLPSHIAIHVGGTCSGDAVLKEGALTGKMKLTGASTKSVGLLVKLASMLDHEDWSKVPWQIFRFDFKRDADGRVDFSDFQALSPNGIAVRGVGHYAPDSLGADLQIGIRRDGRPYLGAFVPAFFSHERDGYYWTPLKVGGTPSDPKENLTERVVTAMAVMPAAGAAEAAVEIPGAATEAVGGLLRELLRH